MTENYLQQWLLTDDQRKGVEITEGNLVVTAGAGTGKTRVLTHRFAHLILSGKADIEGVLAITFTEKAAAQMIDRVAGILRKEKRFDLVRKLPTAAISTIHAFCARTLREYALDAGVDPGFEMLGDFDKDRLARQCLKDALDEIEQSRPARYDVLARTLRTEGRYGADILTAILKIYEKIRSDQKSIAESFKTQDPTELFKTRLAQLQEAIDDYKSFASTLKPTKTMEGNELALSELEAELDAPNTERIAKVCAETKLKALGKIKEHVNYLKPCIADLARAAAEVYASDTRQLLQELVKSFHEKFSTAKRAQSQLDFSDLEQKTLALLQERQDITQNLKRRYKYVLVDEFQDVNPLQAALIQALTDGGNLFVVGDHKQSIYGFRHADVKVFQDVIQRAPEDRRVSLDKNFRTVKPILKFVNTFFKDVWAAESAIPYEALQIGKDSQDVSENPPLVEMLISFDETNGRKAEAKALANRIRQMLDAPGEEKTEPGDIVVLFQSKTKAQLYMDEFLRLGIPYQEVKGQGFFQRGEIADLHNYLEILADPYNEIALAAVLRSPFVQIDPSGLYSLATAGQELSGGLYEACQNADSNTDLQEAEKIRIRSFLKTFSSLSHDNALLCPKGIVREIYDRTGYRDWALTQPDGARKIGNMEAAAKMADTFSGSTGSSLADIADAFAENRRSGYRAEDASTGPAKDAVTIMTIHAAKGLEAPMVFLADCNRMQNNPSDPIVYHLERGIGFKVYLPDFTDVKTESYANVTEGLKEDRDAELRRLFYVATTRAEKKLIFSAGFHNGGKGNYKKYGWAKNLLEFLSVDINEPLEPMDTIELKELPPIALTKGEESEQPPISSDRKDEKLPLDPVALYNELPDELPEPDGSQYLYTTSQVTTFAGCPRLYYLQYRLGIPTELLGDIPEDLEQDVEIAGDVSQGRIDAIGFGNAFHELMQYVDPANLTELPRQAEKVGVAFGVPEEKYRALSDALMDFYHHPDAKDILCAKKLYRELPLVWHQQNRMIRGQIDLVAQTDHGLWLVDYKTNQLKDQTEDDIVRRYTIQMTLYAMGIKAHLGKYPDRVSLYLTEAKTFKDIQMTGSNFEKVEKILHALFKADAGCEYPPNEKRCPTCRHRKWCMES